MGKQRDTQLYDIDAITRQFNPLGKFNSNKQKYSALWTRYTMLQATSRFIWENLPEGLDSELVERMLYYRASLVFFKRGGVYYLLPYTLNGNNNFYFKPNEVIPVLFTTTDTNIVDFLNNKSIEIDNLGRCDDTNKGYILHDNKPYYLGDYAIPPLHNDMVINNDIADTMSRIINEIKKSTVKKLFLTKDPKQASAMKTEIESIYSSDNPFAIIQQTLDLEEFDLKSDLLADDLFNAIKNYDSMRCLFNGISNSDFGSNKKERLITDEIDSFKGLSDLILDSAYRERKKFVDKVNKCFGLNISVVINPILDNKEDKDEEKEEEGEDDNGSKDNMVSN